MLCDVECCLVFIVFTAETNPLSKCVTVFDKWTAREALVEANYIISLHFHKRNMKPGVASVTPP